MARERKAEVIRELYIRNYVLFEEVRITFGPAVNVFTGETGAGKSLLIGALNFLLGTKGDTDLIRTGAEELEVAGTLEIPAASRAWSWLTGESISADGKEFVGVRRVLRKTGRGGCYIHQSPVPRKKLSEFMTLLFELHGQHENQALFRPADQLALLDSYAGLTGKVKDFGRRFESVTGTKQQLKQREQEFRGLSDEKESLEFTLKEIAAVSPEEGEEESLKQRIDRLGRAETLQTDFEAVAEQGKNILPALAKIQEELKKLSAAFPSLADAESRCTSAVYELEDILDCCKQESRNFYYDPQELRTLDRRLSELILLGRKYGRGSVQNLSAVAEEAREKLDWLAEGEFQLEQLRAALAVKEQELWEKGKILSGRRLTAAEALSRAVSSRLKCLGMPNAVFEVHIVSGSGYLSRTGLDQVCFFLSANPGEPPREVRQIASGGEISRIMLAVKSECVNESDPVDTIIFDEIDAGIGGETGVKIAEYMHLLGKRRQIICITHLASIASSADTHIQIEKKSSQQRTFVQVRTLAPAERTSEIARMLSGNRDNNTSLAHAKILLEDFRKKKEKGGEPL